MSNLGLINNSIHCPVILLTLPLFMQIYTNVCKLDVHLCQIMQMYPNVMAYSWNNGWTSKVYD